MPSQCTPSEYGIADERRQQGALRRIARFFAIKRFFRRAAGERNAAAEKLCAFTANYGVGRPCDLLFSVELREARHGWRAEKQWRAETIAPCELASL
ncbi:MAG: hypothetical protein KDA41_19855 [Planctomycetales bacterium]|nr:hypothetical protein [Planctomycetales bacterium]